MMQQNKVYNLSQKQLSDWIDQVSFALNEVTLYLNSHPTDSEALSYFDHFQMLRKEALEIYSKNYSPLNIDSINTCQDKWKWVYGKWPWEGGNC